MERDAVGRGRWPTDTVLGNVSFKSYAMGLYIILFVALSSKYTIPRYIVRSLSSSNDLVMQEDIPLRALLTSLEGLEMLSCSQS
jgi:hypothetical protein